MEGEHRTFLTNLVYKPIQLSVTTVYLYFRCHGESTQVCMYIPALFMGPRVKKGYQISGYTTDKYFAPTALNALGLHPGQYMVGKVVEEIYET